MAASAAGVPGLGGEVLRDGALGVQRTVLALARVDPRGRVLDVGAGGLEPDRVRDDQLVGVALLG